VSDSRDLQAKSPSLTLLATGALRGMILSGELMPGEHLVEERLTEHLGISRPPLREAMRILQHEGLIVTRPRRGSAVVTLTDQDVYEIITLRRALERLAVELGVPVRDPERLQRVRLTLRQMEEHAAAQDRPALVQAGYDFHAAIVGIAGHRRLEETYGWVKQQMLLCMARNLQVREHFHENLDEHVARHRRLFERVEAGDQQAVLNELAAHGESSFTSTP
jgi:DNA-binding GntR family transcriptional regulator